MRLGAPRRWVVVSWAVGLVFWSAGAIHASASPRQQWLTECAIAYGNANFDAASGLIKDAAARPNVATASPGYVVAALATQTNYQQALTVLQAVLANQDQAEDSPTCGQFPWWTKDSSAPSLQATYRAVPPLAYIHQQWGQTLPEAVRQQLAMSLRWAGEAIRRPTPSSDDLSPILRAASLAMLAATLDEPAARQESLAEVNRWLARLVNEGLTEGHSPAADVYRIAGLKWIWHSLPASQRTPQLQTALEFAYRDFSQRIQPGSAVLAGAALYSQRPDYLSGNRYSRYLLYADLAGPQPGEVDPFAMFFTTPAYALPADLAMPEGPIPPGQVVTTARGQGRVTRTDTYMHPLFSLGTMSGRPARSSIPLLVTFAGGADRPTAYFFTQPQAQHISSIQKGNIGLITVDFDNIGVGDRRTARLHGVLGPRAQIEEVYLAGQPWNGQPAAVAEMGKVAIKRLGCYLGLTVLRAGPAEARHIVSGPQPGVLRWSGEGPDAELELLIYGRKRSYPLAKSQHDVRAGVAIEIHPQPAYESLADFARYLAANRLRQTVERTKELIPEPEDPHEAFLRKGDPKPRSELRYEYKLIHTLEYRTDQAILQLQEEMLVGTVIARQIDGEEVVAAGPWMSEAWLIPWGASPESLLTRHP